MFNRLIKSVMGAPAVSQPLQPSEILVSTPDVLLIGSVREAILGHISDWAVEHSEKGKEPFSLPDEKLRRNCPKDSSERNHLSRTVVFTRKTRSSNGKFLKPLVVELGYEWRQGVNYSDAASERYPYYGLKSTKFKINGISVSPVEAGYEILKQYVKLRDAFIVAEKAAADAVKNMQENEKKWDLFEEITGMKRDGNGRLVAVSEPVVAKPETTAELSLRLGKKKAKSNPFHPHCCEVDASGETCLCVTK